MRRLLIPGWASSSRFLRSGPTIGANLGDTAFIKAVSSPAVDPLVVGVGATPLQAALVCDTCGIPGTYQG